MPRKTTSVVACLAALALALPAAATSADTADTLINHGYDTEEARLLFTVLDAEEAEEAGEYECVEPTGDDAATDEEIAGTDPVDEVETNGEGDDPDDGFECELTAVDVTGPEGQVNHGTVVSSVVHVLKSMGYKGIGCIVRVFAQSDYGKGDQQVKVADGDDDGTDDTDGDIVVEDPDVTSEESTTELEESLTTCRQGDKDDNRRDKDDDDKDDDDKDDEDKDRQERKSEDRAEKKGKPFGDDHPSARKGRNGRGGDDDKSDGPKKQKSQQKSENTSRGGPDGKGSERGKGKPGR